MYGRERNRIVEALLFCLSIVYTLAVELRLVLYRFGFIRIRMLPVRVISVGNITLGGTGKTPTITHLADLARRRGTRAAVLSRGYGRRNEQKIAVVSDGRKVLLGPEDAGDEPAMIAAACPGTPVVVGSDRYRAGREAVERFDPAVVLLDDGFQHVRLHRDLNIVLIDGSDPFGNGRLFPAGILREPLGQLARADAVLITRADASPDLTGLKERISRHTKAPLFTSSFVPRGLVSLADGTSRPLSELRGRTVIAAAGIARPASLKRMLTGLGATVRELRAFPDHHGYSPEDLASLRSLAKEQDASVIITTEKDAVKLTGMIVDDIWSLGIGLDVSEKHQWEQMLWGS